MRKAAFFDRDGTIIVDTGYPINCERIEIIEKTAKLIRYYNDMRWDVICVSNQSGIARGFFSQSEVEAFNNALNDRLWSGYSAKIDRFYICPHLPEITGECSCRKPKPGMFLRAIKDFGIDAKNSVSYGDSERDKVASYNAGIKKFYYIWEGYT